MFRLSAILIALLAFGSAPVHAQTAAPPPAKAAPTATVKAVQPGLYEATGQRVNDVIAAGILKITAAPGKGWRSIHVQSPWGDSYHGWPADLKPVSFTITTNKGGVATINAPGFNESNKAEYKAAIDAIVPFAISHTTANKNWSQHSGWSRAPLKP